MSNDALFWTAKPPAPAQPKPGEHLWSLRKNGRQVDCELRFQGESYGWECQCHHDGVLAYPIGISERNIPWQLFH